MTPTATAAADTRPPLTRSPSPWPALALSWLDGFAASRGSLRGLRSAVLRDLLLPEDQTAAIVPPGRDPAREARSSEESLARRVRGRVVLITGGSSGIGRETARRVAAAGALTVICGRDPHKLLEAQRWISQGAARVESEAVDLADPADCDALVRRVLERFERVDVLINNAGRSIRRSVEHSIDRHHDFQRTMTLNYFGALRVTLGLLPAMVEQRAGHVINISSLAVLMGSPRFSGYAASKAALDAWTRCAACEYADLGVDFTTIYMPLVRTPMIAPTSSYARVPALSVERAAELTVRAIIERPARVATPMGALADLAHAIAPRWTRRFGNYLFRGTP